MHLQSTYEPRPARRLRPGNETTVHSSHSCVVFRVVALLLCVGGEKGVRYTLFVHTGFLHHPGFSCEVYFDTLTFMCQLTEKHLLVPMPSLAGLPTVQFLMACSIHLCKRSKTGGLGTRLPRPCGRSTQLIACWNYSHIYLFLL